MTYPPRAAVDPWRPHGVHFEEERCGTRRAPCLTVFLAGARCPFSCTFCDLEQYTTAAPTPVGALPAQLRQALASPLAETALARRAAATIKLYNASNFFDARAVPLVDYPAMAHEIRGFGRVVVESHPRLIQEDRVAQWLGSLRAAADGENDSGVQLEVAMGLETAHPEALARTGKGFSLGEFREAAAWLRARGISLRVFVLLGAPYVPADEAAGWVTRSVELARDCGARVISLIPVRATLELLALEQRGLWRRPSLALIEAAFEPWLSQAGDSTVLLDPWDLEPELGVEPQDASCCADCAPRRRARLLLMNTSGRHETPVVCRGCNPAPAQRKSGDPSIRGPGEREAGPM